MKKLTLLILTVVLCLFMAGTNANAQVVGDYGSNASGTWSTAATWVVCVTNGTWTGATTAGAAPTAAKNVWVRSGHTVNISSTGAVGAIVTVQDGGILTSTGANLTATSFVLEANSIYRQAGSSSTIPGSTKNFATTSTVEYNGSMSGLTFTTYGNLIWSSTSTCGIATGNTLTVNGNLTLKKNMRGNSGTTGSNTHTVGGNVIVDGSGVYLTGNNGTGSESCTWNIGGSVSLLNGARIVLYESGGPHTGTSTITINGNLSVDATSSINLRSSSTANTSSLTGTINVKGSVSSSNASGITTVSGTSSGTAQLNINLNGTGAQQWTGAFPTTNLSSNNAACNITMNNSAGLTLNNAVTLNGTLTLTNGKITTTSTNYINVAATGTVSGGSSSSFINGPLQHTIASISPTAKTYPLGKGSFYAPVVLTITQDAATSTNYKAEVFESGIPSRTIPGTIGGVSTSRYYNISKGTGAGVTNGQIRLVYDANDAGLTLSADNMRIVSDQGGADWVDLGPAAGGSSPITSGTNFTSFGNFAIANTPLGTTPDTKTVSGTAAICPGTSTNVSLASSQSGVTYDLYKNGVSQANTKVGDGNDLNWSVSAVGTYTVKTTTDGGYSATFMSGSAVITAKAAPSITGSSLSGDTYPQGGSASNLTVTVTGDGLVYQWYKSDDNSNATSGDDVTVGTNSNSYAPSTATQGTSYYYCVISGDCTPAATSSVSGAIVIVEACTAPTFSVQPTDNLNACINGTPVSLGTVAADQSPTYQWYSNASKSNSGGSIIEGATNSSYSPSTSVAGTFYYYVEAINGACTTASNAVQFTVYPATAIQSQSTATATYGQNASATALTVTAVGKNLSYQWYSSTDESNSTTGDDLTVGANSNSYTPSTAIIGTLYYYCVVSGGCDPASVTSTISGAITIVPYTTGDYKSVASANWGTYTTWQKWNGSSWVATASGDFPNTSTASVFIDGYTVNCETSGRSVKNVYLLNNGNLTSSSTAFSSPSYLKVYGSEISVKPGSKIGTTVSSSSGNSGDGISLEVYSTNLTLTGGGTIYLSRIRIYTASNTVIIDNDVHLNYHGSANAGNAAGYYCNNVDNNILTINAGKTLTFEPWTCFTPVSSSHTNSAYAFTINVNGTLTFIDGTVTGNATANGWSGHTNGYFSLGVTGKAFNLNVGSAGTINVSELYPNGTKADNTIGTGDPINISIASGGVINVSKIADLRNASQSITGEGTFNLLSGAEIKVGNSGGLNGSISTSTANYNAAATYSYNGTAAQVTGTSLPSSVSTLNITNTSGVSLSKATAVSGTLTVNAGTTLKNGGFTFTNNGTANINGTFQIDEGGWATGNDFVYGAAGTLVFNNSTGFYGVSGTPVYWPSTNGPVNVTVQNTGGLELQVPRTVSGIFQTAAGVKNTFGNDLTASGTVRLNGGGYFDNFSPTYSGSGSTLEYNTGGSYGSYNEWGSGSTVGYGVPQNVTINNATTVNLSASRTVVGTLALTSGSIATGANTLTLNGAISGAGTINTASGALAFAGSSEQTLDAANVTSGNVNSLIVNAGTKLTTTGSITATGLTVNSNENGSGTLKGTLSATTANIQQYLASARNFYITSPINNHAAPVSGITRYYEYIEPGDNVPAENSDQTGATAYWKGYTPASLTMTKGKGYIAQVNTPTTVTYSGASVNSSVSIPLTRTAGKTKSGYNLVGNPFTAYLDWASVSVANTNIQPTLYLRTRSSSAYVFSTVNVATPASPIVISNNALTTVTKLIPPLQGFWVRLNELETSGNLSLTTAMVAHRDQSGNTMKAPAAGMQLLRMQISNGTNIDESVLYFTENASNAFDRYDSPKMSNNTANIPEIYTTAGAEELVINGMNTYDYSTTIPLGLRVGETNTYTISASQVQNFDADTKIILLDNNTGTQTNLTAGETYTFTSDATTTTTKLSVLFRSASGTTAVNNSSDNLKVYTTDNKIMVDYFNVNAADASVSVYNGVGQKLCEQKLTGYKTIINREFATGVYVVKMNNGTSNISSKVIIK